jgi:hypothetical protein
MVAIVLRTIVFFVVIAIVKRIVWTLLFDRRNGSGGTACYASRDAKSWHRRRGFVIGHCLAEQILRSSLRGRGLAARYRFALDRGSGWYWRRRDEASWWRHSFGAVS